jgi:hypothetical protein
LARSARSASTSAASEECGLRTQCHLFGCHPSLVRSAQRCPQVRVLLLGVMGLDQCVDVGLPSDRPLQPQHADRVDQVGDRADRDPATEDVVLLDRPPQPA